MTRPLAVSERKAAKVLAEYLKAGIMARTIIREGEVIVEPIQQEHQTAATDFDAVDFSK